MLRLYINTNKKSMNTLRHGRALQLPSNPSSRELKNARLYIVKVLKFNFFLIFVFFSYLWKIMQFYLFVYFYCTISIYYEIIIDNFVSCFVFCLFWKQFLFLGEEVPPRSECSLTSSRFYSKNFRCHYKRLIFRDTSIYASC